MSASDAAALTTRSRSRSGTKALLHIHPEEELAKHDSGRTFKTPLHIPTSSNLDIPTITTRSHTADHHHHHHHHHHHADISKDTIALDASMATRSKSRSKPAPVNSSMREPTISLSTHRVLSYGPSGDDLVHQDSIHSLDGGAHSTDSQSSSKTIPQEHAADAHQDADLKPSSHLFENANAFFTKDVFLHIVCSLFVLGLVVLVASHAGVPASHHLMRTFKSMNMWSRWRPPLATSQQVQELKERLMLTVKVNTEKLEERVEGLKVEMREEMKKRKEEAVEIQEEMKKRKEEAEEIREEMKKRKDEAEEIREEMKKRKDEAEEIREEMSKQYDIIKNDQSFEKTHTHGTEYDGPLGDMGVASVVGSRPDYALASGGGRVVGHSPSYKPMSSSPSWIDKIPTFFIRPTRIHPLAHNILQPSFNQPGQCLPLASSNVHVEVALRTPIYPDQVTLSHVSKSIAYDISSAPKDFQIYGLPPPLSTSKPVSWVLMGEFTYDVHNAAAAQAFELWETAKNTLMSTIKLQVLSNYGSPSHTCIYRLQVHGKEST